MTAAEVISVSDSHEGAIHQTPYDPDDIQAWARMLMGTMVLLASISVATSAYKTGIQSFQTHIVAVGLLCLLLTGALWEGVITRV